MSLSHIFAKPQEVKGIGEIYPIRLKDYDEFTEHSGVLNISKKVFAEQVQEYPLLDLLIYGLQEESFPKDLEVVFSLSLKEPVKFVENAYGYGFVTEDLKKSITGENYEAVRKAIMKLNLIFEPRVFKDKLTQEWANKVLKARAKGNKVTIEDMVSVVHTYSGISYEQLSEYTIYQLQSSFSRIAKLVNYDSSVAFKCAGASDLVIENYAESLDIWRSPYDDLFIKKDKLNSLDSAMK